MTLNLKQYWAAVVEQRAALSEDFPFLTSVHDPSRGYTGGSVVQMSKEAAAEALVKNTHRLSTAEEIEAYRKNEEAQRAHIEEMEMKRLAMLGIRQAMAMQPTPPAKTKTRDTPRE